MSDFDKAKREAESIVANADTCSEEIVVLAEQFLSLRETAQEVLDALKVATETCQIFLDDCGDVRDFTTQADINDWQEVIARAEGPDEVGEQVRAPASHIKEHHT